MGTSVAIAPDVRLGRRVAHDIGPRIEGGAQLRPAPQRIAHAARRRRLAQRGEESAEKGPE